MARHKFLPAARSDLRDIMLFIARDNPARGRSFVEEIRRACLVWAENPLAGRDRPDLRDGLRCFPHGAYLVFYLPMDDGITVARVLHVAREQRGLL